MANANTGAFVNSARKIYSMSAATTPVLTLVPTSKCDSKYNPVEDTWYQSSDVSNGVAHQNGAVVATGRAIDCEAVMEFTGVTPALDAGLTIIRNCTGSGGTTVRGNYVVVDPDGVAKSGAYDVLVDSPATGDNTKAARLTWKMALRGVETTYAGSLP